MITELEKEKARETLMQWEVEAPARNHIIRDDAENDCPSEDYAIGKPNGECETDGHYLCEGCIHYDGKALMVSVIEEIEAEKWLAEEKRKEKIKTEKLSLLIKSRR